MALFSVEELKNIYDVKLYEDHLKVICACTSQRFGDTVGYLRVYANGLVDIECDCYPGCPEGKMTPPAFEEHAQKEGTREWKRSIWVTIDGDKVPIEETALLKYYNLRV